ncbi:class I SAM-dependent methyltransferase [Williamsia sterculiae]|uniref:S-adenosyl-L-methionine-dependent methyltransferase n=1 Tax=Williamsia sterculiae TaxID=1344003 RepID=A0A1N7GS63_9NOCA|nr:SAM-dependent methyltransferase [Williamsia sterculiae]SIS15437.1 methyltransferase, TIGR00027 family [Williamsia sterculiae]
MSGEPLVSHVSDTARWVAVRRAVESNRSDALFRDPLAAMLAGDRGQGIARAAHREIADDWFLVTRTKLIDDHIANAVAGGCNVVVNLGAGLDTRPYRMSLPATLTWTEVDLPQMIEEKAALLAGKPARCRLQRVPLDVTDQTAVGQFLDDHLGDGDGALVVSEGLVMYLDEATVRALASALRRPEIRGWCLDFSSSGVGQLMARRNTGLLRNAPWTFLPDNGVAYFEDIGWNVHELESIFTAAGRLDRLPPAARVALRGPQPDPRSPGVQPYSAVAVLAA